MRDNEARQAQKSEAAREAAREAAWRRVCLRRIRAVMRQKRKITSRELRRRTHYNRSPCEQRIAIWWEALETLAELGELEIGERDNLGREWITRAS